MQVSTSEVKANIFETALALLILIALIFSILDFIDINTSNSQTDYPFAEYYANPGIRKISILKLISSCSFLSLFILFCFNKFKRRKAVLIFYLISALILAALQWFELYYGSTFYYGEVRDKQGLGFPLLSSYIITLIIWKLDYAQNLDKNLTIKLILTVIINLGLYQIYNLVHESWKLWQS